VARARALGVIRVEEVGHPGQVHHVAHALVLQPVTRRRRHDVPVPRPPPSAACK
jgi:hypothetical protein